MTALLIDLDGVLYEADEPVRGAALPSLVEIARISNTPISG